MSSWGRETRRLIAEYSAGTLELGLSVAVGALLGYWLDSVFGTAPWLTLFWLLCGVIAGFRSLLRIARKLEREEEQPRDQNGNTPWRDGPRDPHRGG